MKIEESARRTSVESTIKSFSRRKDSSGAFQALIANHAGKVKCLSISKKLLNLLKTSSEMARVILLRHMCILTGKYMMA